MNTVQCYLNLVVSVLLLSLSQPAVALTLNFEAMLMNGTCTISLDKSTLDLGPLNSSQLKPNTLVAPQPFTLQVSGCMGETGGLTPVVKVTGDGVSQDSRWLFRQPGSADGIGIMVFRSDFTPHYDQEEVRNSSTYALSNTEAMPVDQNLTFYAGISCGGPTGCASSGLGDITARLIFSFALQ
ncbi:fimbrial protein [Klebsiella pasteurii]|uniref:fimbrial protein n=1 Tax=Klebsiella pasteurii TaxID=2587529 RepID=UPI00237AD493|nr:hypothetical protein [Klebsiella pasteurii]MDD9665711.1 hypothetical protein [Klebsiella pasteurii]MDD9671185.1 hypothetical protein [Klebsiella pasteurii]MDD9687302.1 hypothetical protein [Klebsiella pasteurii]